MALPAPLIGTVTIGTGGVFAFLGVFEVGGVLYAPLFDVPGGSTLTMNASSDGGQTWAVVDSGGSPSGLTTGPTDASPAGLAGTKIFCVGSKFDDTLLMWIFDTVAGTWSGTVPNSSWAMSAGVFMAYRPSDGNLILTGLNSSAPGNPVYGTFDTVALTYSVGVTGCGVVGFQVALPVHGNGVTHFVFTDASAFLYQQGLSDGGVLGAVQTINNDVSIVTVGALAAISDGTTLQILFAPNAPGNVVTAIVYTGLSQTGSVTFSMQAVALPATWASLSMAFKTGDLGVYYTTNDGTNTNFLASFDTGSGLGPFLNYGSIPLISYPLLLPVAEGLFLGTQVGFLVTGTVHFAMFGPPAPGQITLTFKGMKVFGGA